MRNGPYELILAPKDYPGKRYRGRYAYEHIVVFWQSYGFVPPKGWEIHHVNGNHRDNVVVNLQLVTNKEHRQLHIKPKSYVTKPCGYCGIEVKKTKQRAWGKKTFYCNRNHSRLVKLASRRTVNSLFQIRTLDREP